MVPRIQRQDTLGQQYIPKNGVICQERITDNLSVYTTELVAILLALEWVEGNDLNNSVIISDSYSALESIKSGKSIRNDIIHKICMVLYKLNAKDLKSGFFGYLHMLE